MGYRFEVIGGKRYLWDGMTYENREEAEKAEEAYKEEGFETKLLEEGDQFNVYTRRVVTEYEVEYSSF